MLETILAGERPGSSIGEAEAEPGTVEIWSGLNVADLYAGTGALGIEALSRGAAWCDFVELDAAARRIIERNLETTGYRHQARIIMGTVERMVEGGASAALRLPYGVVLMDPPYRDTSVPTVVERLADGRLLDDNAVVAVEHARAMPLGEVYQAAQGTRLVAIRQRRHGDTVLSIYRFRRREDREVEGDGNHGDLPG
jgi:16S rRNA (guanine966-N2)-methyltransferase